MAWVSDSGAERTAAASWLDDALVLAPERATTAAPTLRGRLETTDEGGFTLGWDALGAPAEVHCLAIGGSDVRAARAGVLAVPGEAGLQTVSVGFRPDLVLFVPSVVPAAGASAAGLVAGFGAAAAGGQAATSYVSRDGARPGTVAGCQRRGEAVAVPTRPGSGELAAAAAVTSFDEDGFTLRWSAVEGVAAVAYLAVEGGSYSVGTDVMRRRSRIVRTRTEVEPAAVLAASWGMGPDAENRHIARLCVGAATSSSAAGCATWAEQIEQTGPTHTLVRSSRSSLLEVPDTRASTHSLHAQAVLHRLAADGFWLDWAVTDAWPREFLYVALGARVERSMRARKLLQPLSRRPF